MKSQHILVLLSLSVTGAAGLYQSEPPAEKVFKNIKTLVGTPSSEVMPAMKFMCASLKVDCNHCHKGEDFVSDEKHEKEAARHMIVMQRELNAKYFNGRTQVTCNTCHNGSPHPQRVPVIAGLTRRTITPVSSSITAETIVAKYGNAVGGNPEVIHMEGSATGFGPTAVSISMSQGTGGKFLTEFAGRKMGYDGTAAWFAAGGQTQVLAGSTGGELIEFGRFYRGAHAFDHLGTLKAVGKDTIGGQETFVLRSGAQNAKMTQDLYFSAKSGFLVRVATYATTILGSMPEFADFGDYRRVGGAMIPFKITRSGAQETSTVQITKGSVENKIKEGFFSPPTAK